MTPRVCELKHSAHQMENSLFYHKMLHTQHFKDCVSTQAGVGDYEGLKDPRENIQNVRSILKLDTQDTDLMCKVLPTKLHGYTSA
jgi:hypothetical protein